VAEIPVTDAMAAQALAGDLLAAIRAVRRAARQATQNAWQADPLTPTCAELLRLAEHMEEP